MVTLATEGGTSEIANGTKCIKLLVRGETIISQRTIVAIGTNGYTVPTSRSADLIIAGKAEGTITNTGADGAESILVARGIFIYENSASGKFDAIHALKSYYIEDDQTVSKTDTDNSVTDLIICVDGGDVVVKMGSDLTAPSAAVAKAK